MASGLALVAFMVGVQLLQATKVSGLQNTSDLQQSSEEEAGLEGSGNDSVEKDSGNRFISTLQIPTMEIAPGVHMPVMSIGDGGEETAKAKLITLTWLSLGGRGIDTAFGYENQEDIAQAISESGLRREDLFITTKIPGCNDAESYIQKNLQQLHTDYIDLLLIHYPEGHCTAAWATMEDYYTRGVLKSIGVSHFNRSDIASLMKTAKVAPHVNQILLNVIEHDDDQIKASKEQGMQLEAYCPLGRHGVTGDIPGNPVIQAIAAAHNVSTYQVALRWILQKGYSLTFQSSSQAHQQSDADVFGFELSSSEMDKLATIHNKTDVIV